MAGNRYTGNLGYSALGGLIAAGIAGAALHFADKPTVEQPKLYEPAERTIKAEPRESLQDILTKELRDHVQDEGARLGIMHNDGTYEALPSDSPFEVRIPEGNASLRQIFNRYSGTELFSYTVNDEGKAVAFDIAKDGKGEDLEGIAMVLGLPSDVRNLVGKSD